MTYRACYEEGRELLTSANIAEADLDARLLLEYVCHTDRNTLLAHGDRPVTEADQQAYRALITRRAEHVPLQHLTGTQNFMGLDFAVNEQVLIPRQDTEILVEEVLKHLHDGMRILDLCTGSGCILISLLHYSNDCGGVGVDLSQEALAVAGQNAAALLESAADRQRIQFVRGDLFAPVTGTYEIIVSNPPYIASAVIPELMPEVRSHEPQLALDGGADGLDFYRRIAEQSPAHLCGGGMLFLEIGYDQGAAVTQLLRQAGFAEVTTVQDYAGLDRVVYATYHNSSDPK